MPFRPTPYQAYGDERTWVQAAIDSNPYYRRELALLSAAVGDRPRRCALDLGSGYGRAARGLQGKTKRIVLLDGSLEMLRKSRPALPAGAPVAADADRPWPFRSASFDLVFGLQILNHVRDMPFFFSELGRVLEPEGEACFSFGNSRSYIGMRQRPPATIDRDGFRRFRTSEILGIGESCGFRVSVVGGSGLASPHRALSFLECLNRWTWTAHLSHLVLIRLARAG